MDSYITARSELQIIYLQANNIGAFTIHDLIVKAQAYLF